MVVGNDYYGVLPWDCGCRWFNSTLRSPTTAPDRLRRLNGIGKRLAGTCGEPWNELNAFALSSKLAIKNSSSTRRCEECGLTTEPPERRSESGDVVGPHESEPAGESGNLVSYEEFRWSYILPPPGVLGGYNEVLDNGAERLFEWAKDESEHRRGLEKRMTDSEISLTGRGQVIAALLVAIALVGGIGLVWAAKSVPLGTALIIVALASLAAAFLGRRR